MSAFHILLVEDNEADILLTTELLVQIGMNHSLSVARDGVEAIDYVLKRGKYSEAVTPNLILLDINLPKASGTEVLSNIKKDDKYKKIPVIIYTSSFLEADRIFCESLGANLYLTKANTMAEFSKRIEDFKNFLSMIL
ncbi:MAG: response regulator [Bacteroidetes bacterium]|nr:response regulator [Bacteroidota bacterium]